MNLPLSSQWRETIPENLLDINAITSFDIWGGMRNDETEVCKFRDKEYQYMTLMHSTKSIPLEYVRQYPPPFLNEKDQNVKRILTANSPIIHKYSLIEKGHVRTLESFLNRFKIENDDSIIILVPLNDKIEKRWKVILCFSIERKSNENAQFYLERNQEQLVLLANKIYQLWLMLDGKDFNLYKVRGTFCEKALEIANYMTEGFSTKVMAEKLDISCSGVEYHIESMRKTLGATNRGNLIAELFRKGIVT